MPAGPDDVDVAPGPALEAVVRRLTLRRFVDERGSLTPLDLDELGFRVSRTFVVTAPVGSVRGGHAHRRVRQIFFCTGGIVDVEFRYRGDATHVRLDESRPAVFVDAGVWAQQTYCSEGATLVVFADGGFDPSEYSDHDRGADDHS